MTYQEIQKKLEKCELTLTSIQNGTYSNSKLSEKEAFQKLITIKESLEKKLNLLKEEEGESMFVSTKGGDTKLVKMSQRAAMDAKKDPTITGITTTKGKDLKEDDLSDEEQEEITTETSHTEVVAKEVHKALIDALQETGHEVSEDNLSSLNPETFTITVRFKDNTQSDYSFEFVAGEVKLDGNIIVNTNKKGVTPILNKTIAKDNLVKYFKNLSEKKGKDNEDTDYSVELLVSSVAYDVESGELADSPYAFATEDEIESGEADITTYTDGEELDSWVFSNDYEQAMDFAKRYPELIKVNSGSSVSEKKGKDLDGDGDIDSDDYKIARDRAIKANMKEEESEPLVDKKGKYTGVRRLKLSDKDKATLKKIEDLLAKEKNESIYEGEGDDHHYIKVPRREYKKTMSILDQNVDPTYVKMEVVDNDGAGNVIIYFIFKHESGFDDMYDDSENLDSEFYQEPDEDPQAFVYDAIMDLRANDITVVDSSADMDENYDPDQEQKDDEEDHGVAYDDDGRPLGETDEALDANDPVLMRARVAKMRADDMKKLDAYAKSPEGRAAARAFASSQRKEEKAREIVRKLKIKRAEIEREMENDPDIESTGGPVADMYGDQLNKIDNAIEKAASVYNKPMDYDTAVGKVNEEEGHLVTFGYDLDRIEDVVKHLQSRYTEGQDFELHIGRGDDLPNAVTLKNPAFQKDYDLNDMLNAAQSDQDRYDAYTTEDVVTEFVGKELEDRNEPLYDKLVPGQGKAETIQGEMLRAINRIVYRYYNDGDKYFEGYGTETAGPAHSFLVNANHPLRSAMVKLFNEPSGDASYERMLKDVLDMILDHIESRQGKYTKNTLGGIFDYEPEFEEEEDDYDDYDDYDDDEYYQEGAGEDDYGRTDLEPRTFIDPEDLTPAAMANKKLNKEHISVGHPDNEPGMLKQDAYDIAHYAVKLYKLLKYYDSLEDQVDFPHWWQSKVVKARDFISSATHYLEFKTNEPAIDSHVDALQEGRSANAIKKEYDALIKKMIELAKEYKQAEGDKKQKLVDQLKDHTKKKKELEKELDQAVQKTGAGQELDTSINELSGDQRNDLIELQNILDDVAQKGEEAREIIRQSFPRMLSKADAYGAFDFGSSANRYDTTLESIIEEIEEYYDEEEDLDEIGGPDHQTLEDLGYSAGEKALMSIDDKIFNHPNFDSFVGGFMKGFKDHLEASQDYASHSVNEGRRRKMKGGKVVTENDYDNRNLHILRLKDVDETKGQLKEFTDNRFKGSELIDDANSNAPDMFGKQIFADLLPKGVASENDAIEALKKHDKSGIKARMGQYAPMFVHVQYHNLEHEGEDYRMHQRQYYNSNFKDRDPDFNPAVSKITLFKITKKAADRRDKEEKEVLGTILVKTDEYLQDLRNLPGLGKRHMEEATRQDLGMSSPVPKRRAKAELKKPGNDGSKVYGLDKHGKRVHIKNINDVDKFKKFELDADINEAKGGQIMPGDYVKNQHGNIYQRVDGKVGRHDAYVRVINGKPGKRKTGLHDSFKLTLVKKDELTEGATCCGKCGRVHVKGTKCKRPFLTGKDHCRNN